MYYVSKRLEISAAHFTFSQGKCEHLHGHNWIIIVHCRREELGEDGMVTDFTEIKHIVKDRLDHQNLNDVLPVIPTAENIARWICDRVPFCYKVEVWETESNKATYEK